MEEPALGRAITIALRLLVDEMHERLAANGFDDLRPAFGYVLNAAANTALTASDIAALLGMTKQGAAKVLTEMEHAGYISRVNSPDDGRARPVALTARGREALAAAARAQRDIERSWAKLSSPSDVAAMRRVLSSVIRAASTEGPPPLRPTW
jgi:DNA-binding MarR family transcriptional regulator